MECLTNDKIYHGCFYKNEDSTNKLILKGEQCLMPTNNPFRKSLMHVPDIVCTLHKKFDKKLYQLVTLTKNFAI